MRIMKVDVADLGNQSDREDDAAPSQSTPSRPSFPPNLSFLVTKENRQARSPDPASLMEARRLLKKLTRELQATPETILVQVHTIRHPALVRLP